MNFAPSSSIKHKLLSSLFFSFLGLNLFAQTWQAVGNIDFQKGYNPTLAFNDITGVPHVTFKDLDHSLKASVMKLNGSTWSYVGSPGFSLDYISFQDLEFHNGSPYLGFKGRGLGSSIFTSHTSVMYYNGNSWTHIGPPAITAEDCFYQNLEVYNGELYVAFSDVSYQGKASVLKYDGSNWVNWGPAGFTSNFAYHLKFIIDNTGTAYVGFQSGSNGAMQVMEYNGTNWVDLMNGNITGSTNENNMTVKNGMLYIAYRDIAAASKLTVMKYDGSTWSVLGTTGFSTGAIHENINIVVYNGTPYVSYVEAIGTPPGFVQHLTQIMKFDGTNWVSIGSQFSQADQPHLSLHDNELYFAFNDANNQSRMSVYKQILPLDTKQVQAENLQITIAPNPAKDRIVVNCSARIEQIRILNMDGRALLTSQESSLSVRELPQGLYLIEVYTEKGLSYQQFVKE